MKYSTSNEKMALIHRALDEELEIIGRESKTTVARREGQGLKAYGGGFQVGKKGVLGSIINRSPVIETVKETDITSKKTEIIELEKKLMALEKKMENLSATSQESPSLQKSKQFHQLNSVNSNSSKKISSNAVERESKGREADLSKTNTEGVYRSLPEEDDASEDSQDYLEIQKIIQRKKKQKKVMGNNSSKVAVKYERGEVRRQRKESVEADTVLKPKYPTQKTKNSTSEKNKQKRDSSKSNKSSNREGPKLQRVSSKNSTKSQNSLKKQAKPSKHSPKNTTKPQKTRLKSQNNFNEQNFQSIQMKKSTHLQKQLSHYKKLTAKYRDQLQHYRVMQMEFKQMSKNFAKSEQIRGQQKKVIEALKAKLCGK